MYEHHFFSAEKKKGPTKAHRRKDAQKKKKKKRDHRPSTGLDLAADRKGDEAARQIEERDAKQQSLEGKGRRCRSVFLPRKGTSRSLVKSP